MAVRDILIVEDQALARMYLCACVEKMRGLPGGGHADPCRRGAPAVRRRAY